MKNRSSIHLVPQPTVTVAASERKPVAKGLRAGDQRPACMAAAAALWREATLAAGSADVARHLGVSDVTVYRWGVGEAPLALGTVLAAPPPVAQVVLRRALDVAMATPWRGEESEVREAIKACGGASELAYRLASCAPEAMTASAREELAEWAESIAARLWALAQRLRKGAGR